MVGLAVALAVALAVLAWVRWDQALIHGERRIVDHTTVDGIRVTADTGDVRVTQLCGPPSPSADCTRREPGVRVRFAIPDDGGSGAGGASEITVSDPARAGPPADLRVLTTAGLGIPPGSERQVVRVIRTSDRIVAVRATLADGRTEIAPVAEGWAVLATRSGFDYAQPLEGLDANGSVVATI